MNLVEYFQEELREIKNETIKQLAIETLKDAPPYFSEVASSSTGKYHPSQSLGKSGLLRHCRSAFYFANKLTDVFCLEPIERDAALCAILLHDICKYGFPGGKHTVSDHDRIGAMFVKNVADRKEIKPPLFNEIILSIAYHYGRWTKRDDPSMIKKFPEDYTKIMQVVHIADVISAQKEVHLYFLEENLIG